MTTVKFTSWRDGDFFIGFHHDYPRYATQGMSKEELAENPGDLLADLESGQIPDIRPQCRESRVTTCQRLPVTSSSEAISGPVFLCARRLRILSGMFGGRGCEISVRRPRVRTDDESCASAGYAGGVRGRVAIDAVCRASKVQSINVTYQRSGALWEARHKAGPVDSEHYVLACSRYIELNPVRAQMVSRAGEYACELSSQRTGVRLPDYLAPSRSCRARTNFRGPAQKLPRPVPHRG